MIALSVCPAAVEVEEVESGFYFVVKVHEDIYTLEVAVEKVVLVESGKEFGKFFGQSAEFAWAELWGLL